jgi:hypothetical protein
MASFNDQSPEDMLIGLRAALAGEAEPLRKFGVNISAARVEAKALEMGLAAVKSELTDADKTMARYQIILADTARQQGDFARTSDGMANASRTLLANLEDLRAKIGVALLPVFEELIGKTNDWIETNGDEFAEDMATAIGTLVDATKTMIDPIVDIVRLYRELDTVAVGTNEELSVTGEVLKNTVGARGPRDALGMLRDAIVGVREALVPTEPLIQRVAQGWREMAVRTSDYNDEADAAEGISFGLSKTVDDLGTSAYRGARAFSALAIAEQRAALMAQIMSAINAESTEVMDAEWRVVEELAARIRGAMRWADTLTGITDELIGVTDGLNDSVTRAGGAYASTRREVEAFTDAARAAWAVTDFNVPTLGDVVDAKTGLRSGGLSPLESTIKALLGSAPSVNLSRDSDLSQQLMALVQAGFLTHQTGSGTAGPESRSIFSIAPGMEDELARALFGAQAPDPTLNITVMLGDQVIEDAVVEATASAQESGRL